MSIQKEFIVRYRGDGHVRFEIPGYLCEQKVANILTSKILKIDGVYRVNINKRQKKLSIRYQQHINEFIFLANQLFQLLTELEQQGLLVTAVVNEVKEKNTKKSVKARFKEWKAAKWANEKYSDAKETVHAAKVIGKLGMKRPKALINDPEKAITDFLNDILLLYLIKIHWTRITQEWLPRPWAFRYEWTAVFYLFYLLMRSRKPRK